MDKTDQMYAINALVEAQDNQHVERMTELAAMALKEIGFKFRTGTLPYERLRDAVNELLSG